MKMQVFRDGNSRGKRWRKKGGEDGSRMMRSLKRRRRREEKYEEEKTRGRVKDWKERNTTKNI